MSSDPHPSSQARLPQPTGGCQHNRCIRRTLPQSMPGGWFLRPPALPLLPAVKPDLRSGAPWEPWASRPFSFHRRLLPSASHTTRRAPTHKVPAHMRQAPARTHRVRITARPRHRHQSQPFLCPVSWPSNVVQAPSTEDSVVLDGILDLHHSTQPSHNLEGACAVVHVSDLCRWREPRTGQSPRFSLHTLVASAPTLRHPTRDESNIHDMMLNKQTSLPNQHGTAFFIDF